MFKKNKQFFMGILIGAFLFSIVPVGATIQEYRLEKSNVKLILDGNKVSNNELPILNYQGYNYIPAATFRDICSKMGVGFQWVGEKKEIQITTNMTIKNYDNNKLLINSENVYKYLLWEQDYLSGENIVLDVDLDNDGKLDYVSVGRDSPNSEKVVIYCNGDFGINLIYKTSDEMKSIIKNLYDEMGDLIETNIIQVALVDFDHDGKQEILLAIGNGSTILGLSVLKINYDSNNFDAKEIAYFEGQENIRIDKNNDIIIPTGVESLIERYRFNNGKFVKVKI